MGRATIDQLLPEARRDLDRVAPADLEAEVDAGALVVDTRCGEHRQRDGELPGSVVVDRNCLEWRLDPSSPHRLPEVEDHDRRVILVCSEGYGSSLAAAGLRRLGLHRATDLDGGYLAWRSATDARQRAEAGGHWEDAHRSRAPDELSWYQPEARTSLDLVAAAGVETSAPLIDVGGGASVLVDDLLARGHTDLTVLDVSATSLDRARHRLGPDADRVAWVAHDVLSWRPERRYGLWHDRAVFHFLVDGADRAAYLAVLHAALAPEGAVVVGTFAADGPESCSGLPVERYAPDALAEALGPELVVEATRREEHHTPSGAVQPFTWVLARALRGP